MTKKVAVIGAIDPTAINILAERADIDYQVIEEESESKLCELVTDVDAILVRTTNISAKVIECAGRLKVISRHGVGFDNIDINALSKRGIPLALAVGSNDESVAEQAMFLILSLCKQGALYHQAVCDGRFDFRQRPNSTELKGKSILIIGFGRIGRQVASRATAFKMNIYAIDPYIDEQEMTHRGVTPITALDSILPMLDIITLHCPLTSETQYMINESVLAKLKSSALIINTARGGIINEDDLLQSLTDNQIAGAGLDVFESEPPDSSNPLLKLPNVVVSPHCAGVTKESLVAMARISAMNLLAGLDGKLMEDVVVNPETLNNKNT
ncbi:MAG: hypothetical protein CL402_08870 [Acidiferrobacteraceae bacterium]|nr:hypothetical protein [Acidiferrobacteraceae bacterium]|tara:strand:- start:12944 stop:13924 length:981 start_codon:yes stop_codon:yes gene_type:complete